MRTPEKAFVDFETASAAPIRKVGSRRYLLDSTTDILMMAWWVRSRMNRPKLWLPGEPFPEELREHAEAGGMFSGWNAMSFERVAWRELCVPRHGFPSLRDTQWVDTMHKAAAANLPRSLDGAAKAVGAAVQKDKDGHNLMMRITNKTRTSAIKPEELARLGEYCIIDVEAEATTDDMIVDFPDMFPWNQLRDIDRGINDRGILIDVDLVKGLAQAAEDELLRLDKEMSSITGDPTIKTSSVGKIKAWLLAQGVQLPLVEEEDDEDEEEPDEDSARDTLKRYRMRKSDIADLLAQKNLSNSVRVVLEMRAEAAKASTKKLKAMLLYMDEDGRVRDLFRIGGAQATMRWASVGPQVHNLVRQVIPHDKKAGFQLTGAIHDGRTGNADFIRALWGNVLPWAAKMLRRCLTAPVGRTLLQGDYAQVEARITAWIAGQLNIVEAFRDGQDVYKMQASLIYKKPVEQIGDKSDERQIGKICIAEGSLVLTDQGLVPIENVTLAMRVWDGVEWVNHDGAVCNGTQEVIEHDGLTATPDHLVWVAGQKEPMELQESAACKRTLLRSGSAGAPIRVSCCGDRRSSNYEGRLQNGSDGVSELQSRSMDRPSKSTVRAKQGVSSLYTPSSDTEVVGQNFGRREVTMPEPKTSCVLKLRRAWNNFRFQFSFRSWVMGHAKSRAPATKNRIRQSEQQRWLRRKQSSLGDTSTKYNEPSYNSVHHVSGETNHSWRRSPRSAIPSSKLSLRRHNNETSPFRYGINRANDGKNRSPVNIMQTHRKVWDIVNAGPRHRFTVSDCLVSNCILGLGYGGGVNVFLAMSMAYGIRITKEDAQPIVTAWRKANSAIVDYWKMCEVCIIAAIKNPGYEYRVGPTNLVSYYVKDNALHCQLPSGRCLRYWAPKLQPGYWPDGNYRGDEITYLRVKGSAVFRAKLYGGLAVENQAQAIAADLLGGALVRLSDAGFEIVLHVHDSVAAEIDEDQAENRLLEFKHLMAQPEVWTAGLPIGADCHIASRFG